MKASEIDKKVSFQFFVLRVNHKPKKVIFMEFCSFQIQVLLKSGIAESDHWLFCSF